MCLYSFDISISSMLYTSSCQLELEFLYITLVFNIKLQLSGP
uniref:Uncharacterized protein n=1 Tax=Arundo donax TaxID=35708 RepID=A0A0A9C5Z7_ARUDO